MAEEAGIETENCGASASQFLYGKEEKMKLKEKHWQVIVAVFICIGLFLLNSSGFIGKALSSPKLFSFLLYLETGRVVKPVIPQAPTPSEQIPSELPTEEATQIQQPLPEPELPVFAPADVALLTMGNLTDAVVDMDALLTAPLEWDLTAEEPTVLILHTHASESYTKTEDYVESSDYRTLDGQYNMLSIGSRVSELLQEAGISVLHDRSLHDYPSYNNSYVEARDSIKAYLEQYPGIRLILDLHRDAVATAAGTQVGYTVPYGNQRAAQLMLVMGTNTGGLNHPAWQENLSLAFKLHAQLERQCPGICRPISLRSQRFNQDLSTGAVLLEVGAAGNTRQEALLAAEILSNAIIALSHGVKGASTS